MRALACLPIVLILALTVSAWAGQTSLSEPTFSRFVGPQTVPELASDRLVASRTGGHQAVAADPAMLCETAVTTAEYIGRLPPRLLSAISLTETGRIEPASGRFRPWPWTINAEGAGQFFVTKSAAIAAVKALQARGVRSIDVGCLQVNLMYHPQAFASLEDAFDPRTNAGYAARFLNTLYAADKDWAAAVAAYHSETPSLGESYRVQVMARWRNGGGTQRLVTGRGAYGDFALAGKAYADGPSGGKAHGDTAYSAFAPLSRVYGAFVPR
jgi:Transglycosylase SLT domain